MADRMLSDARLLMAALKSLDSVMKASLQTLQPAVAQPTAVATTKAVARKPGQKGGEEETAKPEPIKRNHKVVVSVGIIFMKIGSIDTLHDRFQADVNVILKWREPQLDGTKLKSENVDWSQYWNPKVSLANGIGEPKSKINMSVKYDANGRATVRESKQLSGSFFEFMELNQFPFDRQDLTITLVSERDVSEVQLVEDLEERCGINAKAFSSEQEWKLYKEVNVWRKTVVKKANKMTKKHPGFNAAAKASRRPQFFIWNIIVIMSVICSMAFATFVVNLNTPHFRLQLTFILLLTTVTFKFAVNKNLPKISYLTLMDKYILTSMVILFCVCVWHAVIGGIINKYTQTPVTSSSSSVVTTASAITLLGVTAALTVSPSVECKTSAVAATTATSTLPPSNVAGLADNIALGVLLSLYVLLHVVLVIVIASNSDDDMTLNIEVDDDDVPKKDEETLTTLDGSGKQGTEKAVITFPNSVVGYNNAAYYGDQQTRHSANGQSKQPIPPVTIK